MIKIKHGFNWFNVSLKDGLKIYRIKTKLILTRLYRRIKLLCQINKLTLMLLPAWFAFLLITWLWGKANEINPSFMDLLWEYRTDFFTSFIIVLFTSTAIGINKYKDALWFRYKFYHELIDLFNEFSSYLYSKVTDKDGPYAILLSKKRFDIFLEEIDGAIEIDDEIHSYIERIKNLFVEIKKDSKYDILYSFDGASCDHVNICMKRIIEFKDEEVLEYFSLVFDLIHNFGYIWRMDIDTRVIIDKILHENYGYEHYDDRFLYEIHCCHDITKNPWKHNVNRKIYKQFTDKENKFNKHMKKQQITFENFECLFPEEEDCLKYIIDNIQKNKKFYYFNEHELESVGLHLEHVHSLINKKYIVGQLFENNTRGAISLTAKGLDYFKHKEIFINLKKKETRKQNLKHWVPFAITTLISIISLIMSIINRYDISNVSNS